MDDLVCYRKRCFGIMPVTLEDTRAVCPKCGSEHELIAGKWRLKPKTKASQQARLF